MKSTSFLKPMFFLWVAVLSTNICHANSPIKTIDDIAGRLESLPAFEAEATFRVSMEQLSDDIVYQLRLCEQHTPADPFDTNSYIIDWTMTDRRPANHGFSAYYSGNHFRFANQRLQEYHAQWDSIPFNPSLAGLNSQGIQRSAQFFNLLPQAIAAEMRRLIADTTYSCTFQPDTIAAGRHVAAFRAKMTVNGAVANENEYLFDPQTCLPISLRIENNPGTISEQTIDAVYDYTNPSDLGQPINEQLLAARYADIFANYRTTGMTLDKLAGRQLPRFSLPTITGERYSRNSADRLRCPAIVVLADTENETTPLLIRNIRAVAGRLSRPAQIIWAFTDNVADRIEPILGDATENETALMNAHSLIRDCGATVLPVVLIVDSGATIKNVISSFNNDTISDVIQKMNDFNE